MEKNQIIKYVFCVSYKVRRLFREASDFYFLTFNVFFSGLTAAAAAAAAATNAAIAEAMKVKKIKLEAMSNYHASNNQHGADSENGDMNSSVGKFYID